MVFIGRRGHYINYDMHQVVTTSLTIAKQNPVNYKRDKS